MLNGVWLCFWPCLVSIETNSKLFHENCLDITFTCCFTGKSTTGVANAMIPAFTSFQYPPTLRTRAMGMTNFSAGFALVSVPYIWLLVSGKICFLFQRWSIFILIYSYISPISIETHPKLFACANLGTVWSDWCVSVVLYRRSNSRNPGSRTKTATEATC